MSTTTIMEPPAPAASAPADSPELSARTRAYTAREQAHELDVLAFTAHARADDAHEVNDPGAERLHLTERAGYALAAAQQHRIADGLHTLADRLDRIEHNRPAAREAVIA